MTYRLAIFDMDGTLTSERLDFTAIRRDIGLPADGGIIEHINAMSPADQERALEILDRHEQQAAGCCELHDGALVVLATLRTRGIRTALLTRNSAQSARTILTRHGMSFDHVATRENAPHKPHPGSILNITQKLAIDPRHTLMIGDYLYDLQAAQAAGTDSALLWCKPELPPFAGMATYVIRHLEELLKIFEPASRVSHSIK